MNVETVYYDGKCGECGRSTNKKKITISLHTKNEQRLFLHMMGLSILPAIETYKNNYFPPPEKLNINTANIINLQGNIYSKLKKLIKNE